MTTNVLVVEDDLEINELLGEYLALENLGYLKATTGQAGIHLAQTQHPDAIILDLMLPDVDGFEVARRLTGQRATYDVPVIILSCLCQDIDKEKGFKCGALSYLSKPFLPDDLLATLRQTLAWKAALPTRPPAGTALLGCANDAFASAKAFNQMAADLFARTNLSDQAVADIRAAMELLSTWAQQWRAEHPGAAKLRVDYQITPGGVVEWKMTEEEPGLLEDAFFKPAVNGGRGAGWGTKALRGKPEGAEEAAVAAKWGEILVLTGAARFEKDAQARWVRWARGAV